MFTSQQKAMAVSIANAPLALALTRYAVKNAGSFWGSFKPSAYVPVIRDHKVLFGAYTVLTAAQYFYALKARREAADTVLSWDGDKPIFKTPHMRSLAEARITVTKFPDSEDLFPMKEVDHKQPMTRAARRMATAPERDGIAAARLTELLEMVPAGADYWLVALKRYEDQDYMGLHLVYRDVDDDLIWTQGWHNLTLGLYRHVDAENGWEIFIQRHMDSDWADCYELSAYPQGLIDYIARRVVPMEWHGRDLDFLEPRIRVYKGAVAASQEVQG